MVCTVKEGNVAIVSFKISEIFIYVAFLLQIALTEFYCDFTDISALD